MAESINCKYEKEFDEILESTRRTSDHYNLTPGTPLFGVATELENLAEALHNYKQEGCVRDNKDLYTDDSDIGGFGAPSGPSFGFNSRKSRRKSRKSRKGRKGRKTRKSTKAKKKRLYL